MASVLVAVVSGLVMVWALVHMLRHKLNETAMGVAIYQKLRGSSTASRLLRAIFRDPLLALTKEAGHLPETRSMMRSYWMSGVYGLIFIISLIVFAASTGQF